MSKWVIVNKGGTVEDLENGVEEFKNQGQYKDAILQMIEAAGVYDVIFFIPDSFVGVGEFATLTAKKTLYDRGNKFIGMRKSAKNNGITSMSIRSNRDGNRLYKFIEITPFDIRRNMDVTVLHELTHAIQDNDKKLSFMLSNKGVGMSKFGERQAQFMPFVIMFLMADDKEKFMKESLDYILNQNAHSTFGGYNIYEEIKKFIKDYAKNKDEILKKLIKDGSVNVNAIYEYTKSMVLDNLEIEQNTLRKKINAFESKDEQFKKENDEEMRCMKKMLEINTAKHTSDIDKEASVLFLLDMLNSKFYNEDKKISKSLSHAAIKWRYPSLTEERNQFILNRLKGIGKYGDKNNAIEYINTKIDVYEKKVERLDATLYELNKEQKDTNN
jgi:hypothetical protein